MARTDTRQVVGGAVFAPADAVSHRCKGIYGAAYKNTWLKGLVLSVSKRLSNPTAKRTTSYVTARYTVGTETKDVELGLQRLKDHDPNGAPVVETPTSPAATETAAAAAATVATPTIQTAQANTTPPGSPNSADVFRFEFLTTDTHCHMP